jgi:hypothetical protein
VLIVNRVFVSLVAVSMASLLVFWLETYASSGRIHAREQPVRTPLAPLAPPEPVAAH